MARLMRATTPYSAATIAVPDGFPAAGRANILAKPLIPSAYPEGRQCRHKVRVLAMILRRTQQFRSDKEFGERQASGHNRSTKNPPDTACQNLIETRKRYEKGQILMLKANAPAFPVNNL
jgi:hypothetical protein